MTGSFCYALSGLDTLNYPDSQGVALGWYVLPLRGGRAEIALRGHLNYPQRTWLHPPNPGGSSSLVILHDFWHHAPLCRGWSPAKLARIHEIAHALMAHATAFADPHCPGPGR